MKLIFNKIIPFKGYSHLSFCGIVFCREEYRGYQGTEQWESIMNHEAIHYAQQKELFFVGFFVLYFLEWLFRLVTPPWDRAYWDISFEREAREHEDDFEYLKTRKKFAQWRKNN